MAPACQFDVLVTLNNPNDGLVHSMAVYCLDWDQLGRTQTLDLLNPSTGHSRADRRSGLGVEFQ